MLVSTLIGETPAEVFNFSNQSRELPEIHLQDHPGLTIGVKEVKNLIGWLSCQRRYTSSTITPCWQR
jgi:hypothetical protein